MSSRSAFSPAILALTAAVLSTLPAGCQPAQPPAAQAPQQEEPAMSLAQSTRLIQDHAEKIREAFGNEDPVAAHDEMHEIGNLLTELPELPEVAKLPAPQQAELQVAAESLLDAFMQLDGVLHGGADVSWDDVGDKVAEGMQTLKPHAAPAAATPDDEHDHDHGADDDHGHDDHDHENGDHDHDDHDHGDGPDEDRDHDHADDHQ